MKFILNLQSICLVFLLTISLACDLVAQVPGSYTMQLEVFATQPGIGPIDVGSPNDGSGNVFVAVNSGEIFSYDQDGNSIGTLLDMNTISGSGFSGPGAGESGAFRGLAYFDFHPDYANAGTAGFGKIYVNYRSGSIPSATHYDFDDFTGANTNGRSFVIAEFTVNQNTNTVDPNSLREVYRVRTQGGNPHGIGEIAFNPMSQPGDVDYGLLYAAIGDANSNGNANPLPGYLQNLNNPFGKIICIDPLAQPDGSPFAVPSTNPFDDGGTPLDDDGLAEEIYAFGLRNPQTFSFSRDFNGETILITADIGGANIEEISLVRSSGNYGWDRFEGTMDLNPTRPLVAGTVHSEPVVEYFHGDFETTGRAIIGGVLVSDPNDPDFQNQVVYSDLVNGNLFYSDYAEMLEAEANGTQADIFLMDVSLDGVLYGDFGQALIEDANASARGDARFGFDANGELFIMARARSTSSGGQAIGSEKIFKTGLFQSFAALPPGTTSQSIVSYSFTSNASLTGQTGAGVVGDAADQWMTEFIPIDATGTTVTGIELNDVNGAATGVTLDHLGLRRHNSTGQPIETGNPAPLRNSAYMRHLNDDPFYLFKGLVPGSTVDLVLFGTYHNTDLNRGSSFTVNGITLTTTGNVPRTGFQENQNYVFFDDVLVSAAGTLRVDISANGSNFSDVNGFQLDLSSGDFLLGDVNLDGMVTFLDIAPFIAVLSSAGFQFQADCDQNGVVNFLDIAPFIAILSGQ